MFKCTQNAGIKYRGTVIVNYFSRLYMIIALKLVFATPSIIKDVEHSPD